MRKIAFFVEGQTEAIFTKRLLTELANENDITFRTHRSSGPLTVLTNASQKGATKYYALIWDCENDATVKSKLLENIDLLAQQGFTKIIGLRDLRPIPIGQLRRFQRGLAAGLNRFPVSTEIVVAVAEIEAWFIAEWRHFSNIHPRLTPNRIRNRLNFDVRVDDARQIDQAFEFLRQAYAIFNVAYNKKANHVRRTVKAMDFNEFYGDVRQRVPEVDQFVTAIENFL